MFATMAARPGQKNDLISTNSVVGLCSAARVQFSALVVIDRNIVSNKSVSHSMKLSGSCYALGRTSGWRVRPDRPPVRTNQEDPKTSKEGPKTSQDVVVVVVVVVVVDTVRLEDDSQTVVGLARESDLIRPNSVVTSSAPSFKKYKTCSGCVHVSLRKSVTNCSSS
jgi:hypothetical protein